MSGGGLARDPELADCRRYGHRFSDDAGEARGPCERCGRHSQTCRCEVCAKWSGLTRMQKLVADGICDGKKRGQIAEELRVSTRTFDSHRLALMKNLGVVNEVALLRLALRNGWVIL